MTSEEEVRSSNPVFFEIMHLCVIIGIEVLSLSEFLACFRTVGRARFAHCTITKKNIFAMITGLKSYCFFFPFGRGRFVRCLKTRVFESDVENRSSLLFKSLLLRLV